MDPTPKPGILALGLLGLLAVGVGQVKADFCEDFDHISAAAAAGFGDLRGEQISHHIDPISDTRIVWQCLQGLPGADRCEVEWRRQTYTYQLLWLGSNLEAHEEIFGAVKELITGCGATEKKASKSGQSIWFIVEGQKDLDIVLAYNANRVRLSFSVIGFPNPGLE